MNVSAFSTGRVRLKQSKHGVRRYFDDRWGDETLPVNVFVIEHPGGLCVVDAGQTVAASHPGYFPRWYPFFRLARFELGPHDEASSQMTRAGFDLRRVRWVVLTHLHTDHVGGLAAFQGAQVIVNRLEWELAQGLRGRLRGYLPQRWPSDLDPTVVDFDGPAVGPFQGSYDIATDGRLLLVPLPGHTRGHAALLVRNESRSYLCAGDAALRASDLATAARDVADWCHRENVLILTTHDDEVCRLLADPALAGEQSRRPSGSAPSCSGLPSRAIL